MRVENDPELSLNARIDIIDVTNNNYAVMQCFLEYPKKTLHNYLNIKYFFWNFLCLTSIVSILKDSGSARSFYILLCESSFSKQSFTGLEKDSVGF